MGALAWVLLQLRRVLQLVVRRLAGLPAPARPLLLVAAKGLAAQVGAVPLRHQPLRRDRQSVPRLLLRQTLPGLLPQIQALPIPLLAPRPRPGLAEVNLPGRLLAADAAAVALQRPRVDPDRPLDPALPG